MDVLEKKRENQKVVHNSVNLISFESFSSGLHHLMLHLQILWIALGSICSIVEKAGSSTVGLCPSADYKMGSQSGGGCSLETKTKRRKKKETKWCPGFCEDNKSVFLSVGMLVHFFNTVLLFFIN